MDRVTRSAYRQSQQRPSLSQASLQSSAASSLSQSSSSLTSLHGLDTTSSMPDDQQHTYSAVPLPSPSQTQRSQYFGSLPPSQQQQQYPQQQQQNQQQMQARPQQQVGNLYQGQRGDGGGTPDTAPFLQGFSLLAEAAKRAEMAVLMRDLGEVDLS